jgi:hypothetical protein
MLPFCLLTSVGQLGTTSRSVAGINDKTEDHIITTTRKIVLLDKNNDRNNNSIR